MSDLIRRLKGLFTRSKKYDTLNTGGTIGGFKETVEFLDKLSEAKKIRGE